MGWFRRVYHRASFEIFSASEHGPFCEEIFLQGRLHIKTFLSTYLSFIEEFRFGG